MRLVGVIDGAVWEAEQSGTFGSQRKSHSHKEFKSRDLGLINNLQPTLCVQTFIHQNYMNTKTRQGIISAFL